MAPQFFREFSPFALGALLFGSLAVFGAGRITSGVGIICGLLALAVLRDGAHPVNKTFAIAGLIMSVGSLF